MSPDDITARLMATLNEHGPLTRCELVWKSGLMGGETYGAARDILEHLVRQGRVNSRSQVITTMGRQHGKAFTYDIEVVHYTANTVKEE